MLAFYKKIFSHKIGKYIVTSIFVLSLVIFGQPAISTLALMNPYTPGETLDPTCLPGELNCTVALNPVITSGTNAVMSLSGNFGIGTSTPSEKLEVVGNILASGSLVSNNFIGTSTGINTGDLTLNPASSTGLFLDNQVLSVDSSYSIPLTASTTAWENKVSSQWASSGSDIYFTNGNVSIGTSTPTEKFQIYDNGPVALNLKNDNGNFRIGVSNGPGQYGVSAGDVMLQNNSNKGLAFGTNGDNIRMYISDTGNVGVGTNSPSEKLTVTGGDMGFSNNQAIYFKNAAGDASVRSLMVDNGNTIRIGSGGNPVGTGIAFDTRSAGVAMTLLDNGNFGIGLTNPSAKLEVASGEVKFPGGTAGSGYTHFNYSGDGKNYLRGTTIISDNGGSVGIGTSNPGTNRLALGNYDSGSSLRIEGSNSALGLAAISLGGYGELQVDAPYVVGGRFIIKDNGYVGIGTSTPSQKFTVSGSQYLTGAFFDGSYASGTAGMLLQSTGTSTKWVATSTLGLGGASYWNQNSNGASYGIIYNGTAMLGNPSYGNPSYYNSDYKMYVGGQMALQNMSGNNGLFGLEVKSGSSAGAASVKMGVNVVSGNIDSWQFSGSSGSVMATFKDADNGGTGFVGIGTTSPLTRLDVWGGLNVATGTIPALRVNTATGRVGIGTSTPNYKLDVIGDINLSAGSAYKYNGVNVVRASTTKSNYFFGNSGNLTATGQQNTSMGEESLLSLSSGNWNTAQGYRALYSNTTGSYNTVQGAFAAIYNTTGSNNTVPGQWALDYNTTGNNNTVQGMNALEKKIYGSNNVAIGFQAGQKWANGTTDLSTTSNSIYIGANSRGFNDNDDNTIVIGTNAIGLGANSVVLGNNSIVTTALKGNVGIGTTTPTSKLTVVGDTALVGNLSLSGLIFDSTHSTGTAGQFLQTTATGTQWATISGGSSQWTTGTGNIYYNTDNVLIGTSTDDSSGSKLQVDGDVKATGQFSYQNGNFYSSSDGTGNFLTLSAPGTYYQQNFRNSNTGEEWHWGPYWLGANSPFGLYSSVLDFSPINIYNNGNVTVGEGGNGHSATGNLLVGTGTDDSSGAKIQVAGDVNITGQYKINGVPFSGSSQWTTSSSDIYYNSGNVGIGTSTPTSPLSVVGNTKFNANSFDINSVDGLANIFSVRAGTSTGIGAIPGLVAHYKMNDNSADTIILDETGNYNLAASVNSSNLTSPGKINSGFQFSGSQLGWKSNVSSLSSTTYSMSFWVKTSTTMGQGLFGFQSDEGSPFIALIGYKDNWGFGGVEGKISLATYYNSQGYVITSNTSVNDNQWHHVVARRNDTKAELWIDGVKEAEMDGFPFQWAASQRGLILGAYGDGWGNVWQTTGFTGVLDDARLYEGYISNEAIDYLYNSNQGTEDNGISNSVSSLTLNGDAYLTGHIFDSNNVTGTVGQVLTATATGTQWATITGGSSQWTTGTGNIYYNTDNVLIGSNTDDGSGSKLQVNGDYSGTGNITISKNYANLFLNNIANTNAGLVLQDSGTNQYFFGEASDLGFNNNGIYFAIADLQGQSGVTYDLLSDRNSGLTYFGTPQSSLDPAVTVDKINKKLFVNSSSDDGSGARLQVNGNVSLNNLNGSDFIISSTSTAPTPSGRALYLTNSTSDGGMYIGDAGETVYFGNQAVFGFSDRSNPSDSISNGAFFKNNGVTNFWTNKNGGNGTIAVADNGDVAIGLNLYGTYNSDGVTSNISSKLFVDGDVNITGQYKVNGVPFSGSSQWTTVNSDIYYTGGNVGIGTSTPGSALTIDGFAQTYGVLTKPVSGQQFEVAGWGSDYDKAALGMINGSAWYGNGFAFTNHTLGSKVASMVYNGDYMFFGDAAEVSTPWWAGISSNGNYDYLQQGYLGAGYLNINNTAHIGTSNDDSSGAKLQVAGDVNITGQYMINGVAIGGGSGSQTPWTANIDASQYALTNLSSTEYKKTVGMDTTYTILSGAQANIMGGIYSGLLIKDDRGDRQKTSQLFPMYRADGSDAQVGDTLMVDSSGNYFATSSASASSTWISNVDASNHNLNNLGGITFGYSGLTFYDGAIDINGNSSLAVYDSNKLRGNYIYTTTRANGDAPSLGDVLTYDGNNHYYAAPAGGGSSQWQTSGSNVYINSGTVSIGTTQTGMYPLEVHGSGSWMGYFYNDMDYSWCYVVTGTGMSCSSDRNLKKNINEIGYGLNDLMKLKPVSYNWKTETDSATTSLGFIAQDVQLVLPQLVTANASGTLGLNTTGMMPVVVKSIQTINNRLINLFGTSTLESLNGSAIDENSLSITDTFVSLIKKTLEKLSNTFVDMALSIKKLVVKEGIEMTDKATGDIYCVEISNGEFVKTKGACGSTQDQTVATPTQTASVVNSVDTTSDSSTTPIITPEASSTDSVVTPDITASTTEVTADNSTSGTTTTTTTETTAPVSDTVPVTETVAPEPAPAPVADPAPVVTDPTPTE